MIPEGFETSLLVISEIKSPKVTHTLWETKSCLKNLNNAKLYPSKSKTSGGNRLSLRTMNVEQDNFYYVSNQIKYMPCTNYFYFSV